jgi:transcriptional regulator with XRE-family HTH domain
MVNGLNLYSYADDMKRQQKIANNGHAEGFPERLVTVRKERNLTQQALAETVHCALTQLKRYESGASQPTLDVIKRLAQALRVSSDYLLFGKNERGPDEELRLQFEALAIGLRGQVIEPVVAVGFGERRGEGRLRHPAERVIRDFSEHGGPYIPWSYPQPRCPCNGR